MTEAYIKQLKNDKANILINPKTVADAVIDSDGKTTQDRIDEGVYIDEIVGESVPAEPWVEDSMMIDQKVNVDSIDLSGMTTTIAEEIKKRYPANYLRFYTRYDGVSSGISDKPNASKSFVAVAMLSRNASESDYQYQVFAKITDSGVIYTSNVTNSSTAASWNTAIMNWDNSVNTNNIADGAVTYKKINWTSGYNAMRYSGVSGDSASTKFKITISGIDGYTPYCGFVYSRYTYPIGYRISTKADGTIDSFSMQTTPSGWSWTVSGKVINITIANGWSSFGLSWAKTTGNAELVVEHA